jgi:hypothetical protein
VRAQSIAEASFALETGSEATCEIVFSLPEIAGSMKQIESVAAIDKHGKNGGELAHPAAF